MFQDQSELFHECGCESSLGQRQEWRKHLGTASAGGKQLKMEVKFEDLLNAARFCQDLQLSKGFHYGGWCKMSRCASQESLILLSSVCLISRLW